MTEIVKSSVRYTHPEKLKDNAYTFLCKVHVEGTENIDAKACMCHACSKQLTRNIDNPKYQGFIR